VIRDSPGPPHDDYIRPGRRIEKGVERPSGVNMGSQAPADGRSHEAWPSLAYGFLQADE
jgi:hypothetical protein